MSIIYKEFLQIGDKKQNKTPNICINNKNKTWMAAKYKMPFQIQLVVREIKVTQKYPFTSIILRKKW